VDRIAFQPEAHKDGLDPEDTFEGRDDGNTTATAQTKRTLTEGYADSFFGCTVSRQVDGAKVSLATMHLRDLYTDVLRSDTFDVVYESLADLLVILISYETARDLSISLGGKNSLGAFALIPTPDTAHVEGRTAAVTLERMVTLLTEEVIHIEELLVGFFIEGDLTDHLTLFGR